MASQSLTAVSALMMASPPASERVINQLTRTVKFLRNEKINFVSKM